jgi:hypothetical protein
MRGAAQGLRSANGGYVLLVPAAGEPCSVTEFSDRNYNVLWYAEQCLLRLQNHLAAAELDDHQVSPRR